MTETLKGDDKLLERLESLAGELTSDDGLQGDAIVERAKGVCAKLTNLMEEEIHCRLDRVFLESNQAASESTEPPKQSDGVEKSIAEDLNSLYSEIRAVAEMSVDKAFKEPIMRQLNKKNRLCQENLESILTYVRTHKPVLSP